MLNESGRFTNPNHNTRVRGLTAADNTRDFFTTSIPWNGFAVDRVELQRGAISSNRPRTLPPVDRITPWFATGTYQGRNVDGSARPFRNLNRETFNPFQLQDDNTGRPNHGQMRPSINGGPNKNEWQNFRAMNVSLAQTFFREKIGFEATYHREFYRNGQLSLRSDDRQAIQIDFNNVYSDGTPLGRGGEPFQDGTPNPNVGRPFISDSWQFGNNNTSARGLNIPRPTQVATVVTANIRIFDSTWANRPGVDPAAVGLNDYASPPSTSTQAENPANYVGWRNVTFNVTDAEQGNRDALTTSARLTRSHVFSRVAVCQAQLWDHSLVGTYGLRTDVAKAWGFSRDANGSPGCGQVDLGPTFRLPDNPSNRIEVTSKTWSAVAHVNRLFKLPKLPVTMSVFYSRSENFPPAAPISAARPSPISLANTKGPSAKPPPAISASGGAARATRPPSSSGTSTSAPSGPRAACRKAPTCPSCASGASTPSAPTASPRGACAAWMSAAACAGRIPSSSATVPCRAAPPPRSASTSPTPTAAPPRPTSISGSATVAAASGAASTGACSSTCASSGSTTA
ncbi:MAG: hypothetical protein FJ399_03105 [Verrucomicrobia bacterium]|nr:hypothetical protein [Verrucomicrobiota bacterium]